LGEEDRNHWEEIAQNDKARYEIEKSMYSGPWKVPVKKRLQDHLNIPRRPMSAFLAFSHANRAEVKRKNPEHNNTQISRHLAQLWKEAKEDEKKEYIDQEYTLRQKYLADIAVWRQVNEKEMTEQRKHREDFAMKKVMDGDLDVDHSLTSHPQSSDYFPSHEKDKFRSISSEQGDIWNPYSNYAAQHNYCPVPTVSGYQPHPDERYATYPQHHYYQSSTFSAHYAPPPDYSQQGQYSQYYPSRYEHSKGEWTSEQDFHGHHSEQFGNHFYSVASRYQGNQIHNTASFFDNF
jgi:HMG (high mobility group) box